MATASKAKHDLLRELGATPVACGSGLADRVRGIAPQGVHATADLVGGTDEAVDVSPELASNRSRIATIAGYERGNRAGIRLLGGVPGADPGTEIGKPPPPTARSRSARDGHAVRAPALTDNACDRLLAPMAGTTPWAAPGRGPARVCACWTKWGSQSSKETLPAMSTAVSAPSPTDVCTGVPGSVAAATIAPATTLAGAAPSAAPRTKRLSHASPAPRPGKAPAGTRPAEAAADEPSRRTGPRRSGVARRTHRPGERRQPFRGAGPRHRTDRHSA